MQIFAPALASMPASRDDVWPGDEAIAELLDKIVLVASFRRSGTHLTIDSLINNTGDFAKGHQLLSHLAPQHRQYTRFPDWCARIGAIDSRYVVVKTHQPMANFKFEQGPALRLAETIVARARTIYVYRDPRDVMVSLWHYIQSYDPDYRHKDDFAAHLDHWLPMWREHVGFWRAREDIETVRFEDWKTRYETTLDRCYRYLEIDRRGRALTNVDGAHVRRRTSFGERLAARCVQTVPGALKRRVPRTLKEGFLARLSGSPATLTAVAPRKGAMGDWRSMFEERHKDRTRAICGELLIELGYERDDRW